MALNWTITKKCNVCAVDWSRLANYEYSIAALKHVKKVTNFMLKFMYFLKGKGMKVEETSIAGHSLGAQVAAFVGRNLRGALNAIYGAFDLWPPRQCLRA